MFYKGSFFNNSLVLNRITIDLFYIYVEYNVWYLMFEVWIAFFFKLNTYFVYNI